jgi:hypothetical protein
MMLLAQTQKMLFASSLAKVQMPRRLIRMAELLSMMLLAQAYEILFTSSLAKVQMLRRLIRTAKLLYDAARVGSEDTVRQLLGKGADVKAVKTVELLSTMPSLRTWPALFVCSSIIWVRRRAILMNTGSWPSGNPLALSVCPSPRMHHCSHFLIISSSIRVFIGMG